MIRHLALTLRNNWIMPKQKLAPYDTIIYSLLSNLDTYTENTLRYYEHLLKFSCQQAAELIQQLYEPGDGRYFQEVSSKLLLCEHARENKTLQVPITTGI